MKTKIVSSVIVSLIDILVRIWFITVEVNDDGSIIPMHIMGSVFGGSGIILLIKLFKRLAVIQKLKKNGEKIYAEFKKVVCDGSFESSAYYIICEKVDDITGEIKTYKSDEVWKTPENIENIINQKGIKYFPVLINKDNPEEYYIIIDEIKEK